MKDTGILVYATKNNGIILQMESDMFSTIASVPLTSTYPSILYTTYSSGLQGNWSKSQVIQGKAWIGCQSIRNLKSIAYTHIANYLDMPLDRGSTNIKGRKMFSEVPLLKILPYVKC